MQTQVREFESKSAAGAASLDYVEYQATIKSASGTTWPTAQLAHHDPPPSGREAVIKSAASAASPEGFQAVIKSAASAASPAAQKIVKKIGKILFLGPLYRDSYKMNTVLSGGQSGTGYQG